MTSYNKAFAYIGNWRVKPSTWEMNWEIKRPTGHGLGICRYNTKTGGLEPIKSVFDEISVGVLQGQARLSL
jgi:hypothetical protein